MKKLQIGHSDLYASNLGLGCINFGTTTNEKTAFSLIDVYMSEGGNLLDTSNNYAFWNGGDGRDSERCIGAWLSSNPSARKDLIICTKLGALPKDLKTGFDSMQGTSRQTIISEVEKSLDALKTDYIDLLYLHIDDYDTPMEETLGALKEMIDKGYVKQIGASNFRTWRLEKARQICTLNNIPFFCAVQQRYSYLQPVMDATFDVQIAADNELRSYMEYYKDLTLVSHTSLLYGAYTKDSIEDPLYDTAQNALRLKEVKEKGSDAVPFVLYSITKQFGGSIALFTSSSVKHLKQNMDYFNARQ